MKGKMMACNKCSPLLIGHRLWTTGFSAKFWSYWSFRDLQISYIM